MFFQPRGDETKIVDHLKKHCSGGSASISFCAGYPGRHGPGRAHGKHEGGFWWENWVQYIKLANVGGHQSQNGLIKLAACLRSCTYFRNFRNLPRLACYLKICLVWTFMPCLDVCASFQGGGRNICSFEDQGIYLLCQGCWCANCNVI